MAENKQALEKAATSEIWVPIAGYEGLYQVSNLGRVRSLVQRRNWKPRVLSPGKVRGYLQVQLYKDGHRKQFKVHRLVAEAFIPNLQNLPQVNHKDEDKTNNAECNLEWCDSKYNTSYGTRIQRIVEKNRGQHRSDEIREKMCQAHCRHVQKIDLSTGEVIATFESLHEAERQTGIYSSNICGVCLGKKKSAGGYFWKYKEDKSNG